MVHSKTLKYEGLLIVMSVLWGSTFAVQQIGMQCGFGPMTFNALRFALGGVILLPLMHHQHTRFHMATLPLRGSLLAGFFLFAAAGLQQIGLLYTSSANAGFITSLYIVIVPLFALWLGHRPPQSLWVGMVICLFGLYLLSIERGLMIGKGDLLILACAVLWSAQILTVSRVASRGDAYMIACIQFMTCALLSGIAAVCFESCSLESFRTGGWTVIYAGVFSVGIGFTLQVICQKHCPVGPTAVIMSMEAIFAALGGYLLLGQTLTLRALLGCAFILCGVLTVQLAPVYSRMKDHRSIK